MTQKTAIILFNLGGPDAPEAVEPFLFNLFNDPAIIGLPRLVRTPLARFIARRRAPKAQGIYAEMGGKSPILPNTQAQARALEAALGEGYRCFIAMRYWHPMSDETAREVNAYDPDRIILLPLYPQFSTTTTASSVKDWSRACRAIGLAKPTRTIGCYPMQPEFIAAQADLVRRAYGEAAQHGTPRVLFSAHGLPEKVVNGGDPYQWQVEQTTLNVVQEMDIHGLDFVNCYQSRVGPLKWIGPSTEDELLRAKADGVPIVLVPIAFVSEHSETLVELDIEYRHLVEGAPYFRVPTVSTHPQFIAGLARLVREPNTPPICPKAWGKCGCKD
jgi:protoporphyrin/coproporphyrin ferrochelatase